MTAERTTLWYFIGALVVGGAERTLVDLANEVNGDEYDVTIWTIFSTNPLATDLSPEVTVRSLTDAGRVSNGAIDGVESPLVYLFAPLKFCLVARREQPDLIQSFLFYDNVIARIAGVVCSATIITGIREVPNEEPFVRRVLDRMTISLSHAIVSNSTAGRKYAIERGADEENVAVVYNGRDVEQYRTTDPANLRSELDIPTEDTIIGTVGRLVERKGHFDLLDAWPTIVSEIPEAHLVFVGDGADRERLTERVDSLDCADSVHFLGTRQDVPAILGSIDVFVFPSHYEGLPGAVIEAMAAELPIVATPVDGTNDLLENYRTGLFVDVQAPDEIAWATIRLHQHQSLAETLGTAAGQRAASEFTTDSMVDGFERVYRELEKRPEGTAYAQPLIE
ncbi:glycosyltransferase family 1 protein [Haloarcula sp. CBA1130]|uniref:glycosyltransferase n=1 Tax=unclassified Haloarcula TaxID=2624677 RepID=UPI001243D82D|nr:MULTISPECIES: glycosyltransferase [unclassified Haloarcula]KAA9396022.1 glycosyltransferase family 1 protein [Haloarcula sp. CBA1129]KAA9400447.1 glycosyltransferase family 1 protein [Haloarcula sp. CBA1130]